MLSSRVHNVLWKINIIVEQSSTHQLIATLGYSIAPGTGNLGNKFVSTQDQEPSSYPCGESLPNKRIRWNISTQLTANMLIAESADEVLAAKNSAEERTVFGSERIETAMTGFSQAGGGAEIAYLPVGLRRVLHCSQGIEVTPVSCSGEPHIAMDIPDTLGKSEPSLYAAAIAFACVSAYAELVRIIYDRFDTENASGLIIHLDPVLSHAVLDPHPPAANATLVENLPREEPVELATEESKDILGGEAQRAVPHQFRVQAVEGGVVFEDNVRSQFALIGNPVVVKSSKDAFEKGVDALSEPVQDAWPITLDQAVGKTLGSFEILNGKKGIFQARVGDAVAIHLFGQDLVAVDTDLDEEGKPRLQTDVEPAELRIDEIEVQMKTPTPGGGKTQSILGLTETEGSTGLCGTQNTDKAFRDTVLLSDAVCIPFLAPEAVQIDAGAALFGSQGLSGEAQLVGLRLDKPAESVQGELLAA